MDVDVGPADAGGSDADQDLVLPIGGNGDIPEDETGGGRGFDESAHAGRGEG
jgi:hypothetical protein